jgi:tetratricopeptide (TPR) repeat protein
VVLALEVVGQDTARPLGGAKQRAVLAILLLHRGEVLSAERLIDELWGESPPGAAAKVLQGYISRLRKTLGADVLLTRGHGYVLSLAPGQLDLEQFDRLAADGRAALAAGDAATAARRLGEALALWRGPPLSDFTYEPFAQAEIGRLEEARIAALEDRNALEEATGARVISEVPGARGRARFSHVLVRDTLYDRLGAARQARLHLRVGEALEELYAGDLASHLAELAHHFLEASAAGDPSKAIEYARRAAERAVSSLAYEEAVRLYGMALDAVGRMHPPDAVVRCELLLARGEAQTRAGDTPAAKETFLLAVEMARGNGRPEQLARAALGYGGRFVFNASRDDPRLRPLLEEALAALGDTDRELRTRLMARLAGGPLRDEQSRERRATLSEHAIQLARLAGECWRMRLTRGTSRSGRRTPCRSGSRSPPRWCAWARGPVS